MCTTFASRSRTTFAISTRWPTIPPTRAVTAPSAPSLWKLSRRVAAANSLPAPATATTPPAAPPPRGIKSSSSLARLAHGTAPREPFLRPRASCASFMSERQLQTKLDNTVRLADGDHRCRGRKRGRDAASPAEYTAPDAGRPGRRVPRVFPVCVVQNVEDFRPELHLEALRQSKILQQARIQIPEIWPLHDIAAIALLSGRRDAEKRLRAGDVDAVKVWVGRVGDELTNVVHHRAFHSIHKLHVALIQRTSHLREADVCSVGRERAAGDAVGFAALVCEDAGEGPAANDLVRPFGRGRRKLLAPANRDFVQQIGLKNVGIVEVRKRAIQPPVANICRRAAVRRAQAAAGGCSGRVNRHVVNGLAKRVGETEVQSLFEPATRGYEQAMVVGVTARILEENLTKLRVRPEKIPRERAVRCAVGARQPVGKDCEVADIVSVEVSRPAVQVGGTHHRQQKCRRLAGYTNRAVRTIRSATHLTVLHGNVEGIEEARSVNGNLVQIVRPVKVCSTLSESEE